jgi:molybdate transport system substrate-binding protein
MRSSAQYDDWRTVVKKEIRPRLRIGSGHEIALGPGKAELLEHKWFTFAWSVFLALPAGLLLLNAAAAEVTVFAAASLTDSLRQIAAGYEKQTGEKIVFNFGASSFLARQIGQGAPADVFFSADEAKMNELERRDLIFRDTRRSRLSNTLVIVVAATDGVPLSKPKDLATALIKAVALAEPSTVPAGIYARQFLQQQNLWTAVEPKVVPTENVRAALAAVESGNVDAGIVYKTDAAISKKVRVAYEVPITDGPKISYPVAVLRTTSNLDAAKKFVSYLESEAAENIFRQFGFIVRDGGLNQEN